MKVFFLIRSLRVGGAERQLATLAVGLQRRGCTVVVGVFYPGGRMEAELAAAGVRLLPLNKQGRWDVFGFLRNLWRALRQESPHILHGYLVTPNLAALLMKPLFPKIRIIWGLRVSDMEPGHYGWLAALCYWLEGRLALFADRIVANSSAGRDYAVGRGFPAEKMAVIPNGIDSRRFCPDPAAGERLRKEWQIRSNEALVGLVGRLDPMKDHQCFLRAAALVTGQRPDVRFLCLGDGPADYLHRLRALADELGLDGRLLWAPSRDDMTAVYNALDIACLSSAFGEGFPNVIGEAMACGVRCVVTEVGDAARIVGRTGIAVPPRDPRALADGLQAMLEQQPAGCSEAARTRVLREFSCEALVTRTEALLTSLQ